MDAGADHDDNVQRSTWSRRPDQIDVRPLHGLLGNTENKGVGLRV